MSHDATAARVLDAALDAGVRLMDTARGYGASEREGHLGRGIDDRDQAVITERESLLANAANAPSFPRPHDVARQERSMLPGG